MHCDVSRKACFPYVVRNAAMFLQIDVIHSRSRTRDIVDMKQGIAPRQRLDPDFLKKFSSCVSHVLLGKRQK